MTEKPYTMKIIELIDQLKRLPPNDDIYFGGGNLNFYRIKTRGDKLHNIEFDQLYEITLDPHED